MMKKIKTKKTKNKKAISGVVTTVLLITLALAAIIIVFSVVKEMINKQTQLSPDNLCLQESEIKTKSACYNSANNEIEITLNRKFSDKDIKEIFFALNIGKESDVYCCGLECQDCIVLESGAKTYYITSPKPDSITLKVDNCVVETKQVEDC